MSSNIPSYFGPDLVAQRRVQFELQARHDSLVRALRRARKVDRRAAADRRAASGRTASHRVAGACCGADLG